MNASAVLSGGRDPSAVNRSGPRYHWIGWLPLATFPAAVVLLTPASVPRWALMWLVAIVIFSCFKWLSWTAAARPSANLSRKICCWLAWPGMEIGRFLTDPPKPQTIRPSAAEWFAAVAKTLTGIGLFSLGLLFIRQRWMYVGGWCGMFGIVLFLHFGTFHLMSCGYRAAGIDAPPIMDRPLKSLSLGEFWGRRWNRAFRDAIHVGLFRPVARRFSATVAMWATFFFSGIIHEAGISIPAGAGFGLPTLYFILQAAALMLQASQFGKRWSLDHGLTGRVFTLLIVFGPIAILFHPPFVHRVVVPMMNVVCSL